ncbi:MAG TPA: hypothetical protein VLK65_06025 [Vicinamibacteria bacterium]|nr:hypothetical protein [Vicinamibacteria bacterium]
MRRTFMVTLALIGGLFHGSADAQKDQTRRLIVKITSSNASIPLVFTGAYVFSMVNSK